MLLCTFCLQLEIDNLMLETPILFSQNNSQENSVLTFSDEFFGHQRSLTILCEYDDIPSFTYISNGQWVVGFHQNDLCQSSLKWFSDDITYDLSNKNLYFRFQCKIDLPTTLVVTFSDIFNNTATKYVFIATLISDYEIKLSTLENIDRRFITSIQLSTTITDNIDLVINDVKIITKNNIIFLINENFERCDRGITSETSPSSNYLQQSASAWHANHHTTSNATKYITTSTHLSHITIYLVLLVLLL